MPKRASRRGDTPGQLSIPWSSTAPAPAPLTLPDESPPIGLVQRLKWDFCESFPQPTDEAIEAGVIRDEDLTPDNIKAIHDEHAREMLATLHDLDAVMDARRRGVDPATDHQPRTPATKERLRKLFDTEPPRLERSYRNLLDTYGDAFGQEAADAFDKAIRARHAGIPVIAETERKPLPSVTPPNAQAVPLPTRLPARAPRIVARLPIPRPLNEAVRAGHFGMDEESRPIRPDPDEVAEITVTHAEKLIDLLGRQTQAQYEAGLAAYAEDFGARPAAQLDAYVRRLQREGERPELPRQRVRGA